MQKGLVDLNNMMNSTAHVHTNLGKLWIQMISSIDQYFLPEGVLRTVQLLRVSEWAVNAEWKKSIPTISTAHVHGDFGKRVKKWIQIISSTD